MSSESSRVIIVDDMMINRMILSSLLASNGVQSDQVESGIECLEMCKEKDYDLILLDHRMPDFDGVDTFMALKDIFKEKGKEIPVICHTIEEGRKNINLYKAAGFADVLIKPIDPRELSEVLMRYLPEEDALANEEAKKQEEKEKETEENVPIDTRDELDKLPVWLKSVPHLDLVKGVENTGSAEDYVDALYIFMTSIEEKSKQIETFCREEDTTMYRLSVHSLKSMSSLVGARDLSALAKELEKASDEFDIKTIKDKTPELVSFYRKFKDLLAPIKDDSDVESLIEEAVEEAKKEEEPTVSYNAKTIIYIRQNKGIVTKGVEKNLKKAGFNIITVADEPDEIISHRDEADIILYHPISHKDSHIGITMNVLGEIIRDDSKILLLMGDVADLDIARESQGVTLVTKIYERPVDMDGFVEDITYMSEVMEEYRHKKTIYIVDDDPDYTAVVTRWLSKEYSMSAFNSGEEFLVGLNACKPDLILMDYEMPRLDGYELMKRIRSNEDTKDIPVIFLTGKNDKEHVFRILNYKPDGYLLKMSQKDGLLDVIERFFSELMYKKAAAGPPEIVDDDEKEE